MAQERLSMEKRSMSLDDDSAQERLEDPWPYAKYVPGGYSPNRMMKLRGKAMNTAILVLASVAILFFGYDTSVMSQVNTNQDYLDHMGIDSSTDHGSATLGGVVSLFFAGFMVGAFIAGTLGDKLGRLKTAIVGVMFGMLGAIFQASAQNITWMCFARVLNGIGCGHLNTIIPIWTSEVADAHMRGMFIGVEFTMALAGSTAVYWMEYGLVQTGNLSLAWRFPIAFQTVFLIFIIIAIHFYPESPRFLAKTGRFKEARHVLDVCRMNATQEQIDEEMNDIKRIIHLEVTGSARSYYTMLFTKDELHTRRRILLGASAQVFQKLTGIDFIAIYAPEMFSLAGFSKNQSALLAGGNFISYTFSLFVSIFLIERLGRRKMAMIGSGVMCLILIAGGVTARGTTIYAGTPQGTQYGIGVVSMLYLYSVTYGAFWLTTCWTYPTEVFTLQTRTRGVALSTVAFSVAGGIINEIIPYLINAVGYWIFFIFSILNFLICIPVYLFWIETAGRSLEDLELLFSTSSIFQRKAERLYAQSKIQGEEVATETKH